MMSYNWTSAKELTTKVHDNLKSYGIPLWMDTAGGMHGSIAGAMADAVEKASVIVPFMTEKYQVGYLMYKSQAHRISWKREIDFLSVEYVPRNRIGLFNRDQHHNTICSKIIFDLKSTSALKWLSNNAGN